MEKTTYEIFLKYKVSLGYIRSLLGQKKLKGRQVQVTPKRKIWLIDEKSVAEFFKKK